MIEATLASLWALLDRYSANRESVDVLGGGALELASQLGRALEASAPSDESRFEVVSALAWFHWFRFLALPEGEDEKDWRIAVAMFTRIADLEPGSVPQPLRTVLVEQAPPHLVARWTQRAVELFSEAAEANDTSSLDEAIDLLRYALSAQAVEKSDRPRLLFNLSAGLLMRFAKLSEIDDLNEAIDAGRRALLLVEPGSRDRMSVGVNLGGALRVRFASSGNLEDLDEAIGLSRTAMETATTDTDRAYHSEHLTDALHARFTKTRDGADLYEAIDLLQSLLRQRVAAQMDRGDPTYILDNAALAQSRELWRLTEEAMAESRDPARFMDVALTLARLHWCRYLALPADQGENDRKIASELFAHLSELYPDERPIELTAPSGQTDPVDAVEQWAEMAILIFRSVETRPDASLLDRGIGLLRRALNASPIDHPKRALRLGNLGGMLVTRFQQVGESHDLNEAIELLREATKSRSVEASSHTALISNLAGALTTRYASFKQDEDLDKAIELGRMACEIVEDESLRAILLSNLSGALSTRFDRHGEWADGEEAVETCEAALACTASGDPDRPMRLSNLGGTLQRRYPRTEEIADLDRAITVRLQAVESTPARHADRAMFLINLGVSLRERYHCLGEDVDAESALRAWREAAFLTTATTTLREHAARAWGDLAASMHRWPDSAEGYAAAVRLLPLLAWPGVGRSSQERLLTDVGGAATNAAASAIAIGKPDLAADLLTHGRTVLWSHILQTRTSTARLHQVAPALAGRLFAVRAQIDGPLHGADVVSLPPPLGID